MSEQVNLYPDPVEVRHQIGATGQLILSCAAGSVDIRAGDGGEAVVLARSEGGRDDSLPLSVRKSDGLLQIDVADRGSFAAFAGWFARRNGVDFQVTVPRAARVTINTVSADVRTAMLAGEQTYKTVSGDVELAVDGGRLRVSSVSGDVQLRSSQPVEFSVNTTSGDVRVRGAQLSGFDARTVSGDIDVDGGLVAGPLHSAETVSGDLSLASTGGVTVDIRRGLDFGGGPRTLVAGDGSAQLRFRTLSGDVHVAGAQRVPQDKQQHRDRYERARERMERHAAKRAGRFAVRVARFEDDSPTEYTEGAPEPPVQVPPDKDQLEVLRALERGEIDVDEAARRLQEA
jgi:hypothetical protein